MAFDEYLALDGNDIIGVWTNNESLEDLLFQLKPKGRVLAQYNEIEIEKRKKEFLINYLLLRELLDDEDAIIEKDEFGKPFILNSPYNISISHTGMYSVLLISDRWECGVDVEKITPRINQVAYRFVSDYEQIYITPHKTSSYYTVIWSIKESIYKWYAQGGLDFKEHMIIHPFTLQQSGGPVYYEFVKDGKRRVRIGQYLMFHGHIITWVLDDAYLNGESE